MILTNVVSFYHIYDFNSSLEPLPYFVILTPSRFYHTLRVSLIIRAFVILVCDLLLDFSNFPFVIEL